MISGRETNVIEKQTTPVSSVQDDNCPGLRAFDTVLSEINEETLAAKISLPADTARAGYVMDSVTVKSNKGLHDIISSFYIHLLRHTQSLTTKTDTRDAEADAIALLERAFKNKGGYKAALYEARSGTYGGMRLILDNMTEQYKMEEQGKYINSVLKKAVDSLGYDEKVNFIKAFLKRFGHHLPEEIKSQDPKRYATHYEEIVRLYVKSLDRVKQYLHQL